MSENLITAKIFKNGGNQAVRIPVEMSLNTDEVFIRKTEQGEIILTPKRKSWAEFFALPLPEVPFEREAEITIAKPDLF